jgi:hypothetical protein
MAMEQLETARLGAETSITRLEWYDLLDTFALYFDCDDCVEMKDIAANVMTHLRPTLSSWTLDWLNETPEAYAARQRLRKQRGFSS